MGEYIVGVKEEPLIFNDSKTDTTISDQTMEKMERGQGEDEIRPNMTLDYCLTLKRCIEACVTTLVIALARCMEFMWCIQNLCGCLQSFMQ